MPTPGVTISNTYRLEKMLGKGGMGEVWLAHHMLLNEPRAIKLMLGAFTADENLRDRFIQGEARNALRLTQHPNLVRTYELGLYEDSPYIVMEYVAGTPDGSNLLDLLKKRGSLDIIETGSLLTQIAAALEVAHHQGIIHRDIKPANILIAENGLYKLTDFGLTKDLEEGVALTVSGFSMGSLHYMSPEQAEGQAERRSDLYSLGVVLYEALAGRPPFTGTPARLMYDHSTKLPPPLKQFAPEVPAEVEAVVLKALAKRPDERYSTVRELAEAYQHALHHWDQRQTSATRTIEIDARTEIWPGTSPVPLPAQNPALVDNTHTSTLLTLLTSVSPTGFPSGTLTFIFTDIPGSTEAWELHPEAMKAAMLRHDAILRKVVESNGGQLYKKVGDAASCAFNVPENALQAAIAAQRQLLAEDWGEVGSLKVSMALHTCPVEIRDQDFVGPALNRLARLLAVTHAGQILLSLATAQLVRDWLPAEVELRDLGSRRLKDLIRPENIFQLIAPDLPAEFPALKTLENFPNNLPVQLTSFVGRERELAQARLLLQDTHLLTLTGAGGTGKTRLSLQLAGELLDIFEDGVWLVELASTTDHSLVTQALASVLSVREEPGRPLLSTLTDYLRNRKMLLVLDNCEHLIMAVAKLAETLLKNCPDLKILASSRESFGISGETTWRTPSLSLPDPRHLPDLENLTQYESVKLFIDRAATVKPDFTVTNENAPAMAQICYQLDGIPLALELAAARIKALSIEQIAARLDQRFRLLTGGSRTALPRQQTLKALIDWSYDLLSEEERKLLHRLSIFSGGWTLEAAETICAGDGLDDFEVMDFLSQLVNKSLVVVEETDAANLRYRLLESIRQYAQVKLAEDGEAEVYTQSHCNYYLTLAEEAEPQLTGSKQLEWLSRLEQEHDNLRAALNSSLLSPSASLMLRLCAALWRFWQVRGYYSEGRHWLAAALERLASPEDRVGRARALSGAGVLAQLSGDYPAAIIYYEESLSLWRELADRRGVATALHNLGNLAFSQGDNVKAYHLFEQGLVERRELKDKSGIAISLGSLASVARLQGDYVQATTFHQESLALRRELKDKGGIATSLTNLGNLAYLQEDFSRANNLYEESLQVWRELGNKNGSAISLNNLGNIARLQGNYERATALLNESLKLRRELGDRSGLASTLNNLGNVACSQGDYSRAKELQLESLQLRQELGDKRGMVECLEGLATIAARQDENEQAARLGGILEALHENLHLPLIPAERVEYEQALMIVHNRMDEIVYKKAWNEGQLLPLETVLSEYFK